MGPGLCTLERRWPTTLSEKIVSSGVSPFSDTQRSSCRAADIPARLPTSPWIVPCRQAVIKATGGIKPGPSAGYHARVGGKPSAHPGHGPGIVDAGGNQAEKPLAPHEQEAAAQGPVELQRGVDRSLRSFVFFHDNPPGNIAVHAKISCGVVDEKSDRGEKGLTQEHAERGQKPGVPPHGAAVQANVVVEPAVRMVHVGAQGNEVE